jgi:hypothetical protein
MVIIIVAVITIAVVLLLVLLLMFGAGTKNITANEWNDKYSEYSDSLTDLDFQYLGIGDTVVITGEITDILYYNWVETTYIELDGQDLDMLYFDGNLADDYDVGDRISITFHIEGESAYGFSVEYIEELGLYGMGLPASCVSHA